MTRDLSSKVNSSNKSFRIDDLLGQKSVVYPSPTVSGSGQVQVAAAVSEKNFDSLTAIASGQHVGLDSTTLGKINLKENSDTSLSPHLQSSLNFVVGQRQRRFDPVAAVPLIPSVLPGYSNCEPLSSYQEALYQSYNEIISGSLPISYYNHRLREASVITSSYRRYGFLENMLTSDETVSAHPLDDAGMCK